MIKLPTLAVISVVLFLTSGAFGQSATPKQTVTEFYQYGRSHSQTFNQRWINTRKRWLSTRFYGIFVEELREEKAYLKQNPTDKPYFGDGLSFSPLNEPCDANGRPVFRTYRIQTAVMTGKVRAKVPVRFYYPKPCAMDAITYQVKLVKTGAGWVIDDLVFEDGSSLATETKKHHY